MARKRDAEAELNLPPGFRFHPTDEELVVHYLCRKAASQYLPVPIIAEIDLYKYDPWELPDKALFGQKEWYFFTPRDRKYPNGSRPNRAAGKGYWKATGADKPVLPKGSNTTVGIKKALVFYSGKAPQGTKTDWIMHEYRLADAKRWEKLQSKEKTSFVETMDSVDDTASYSIKTPESDVENDDVLPNINDLISTDQVATGPQALAACNADGLQMIHRSQKEDSEWFTDLKLEDLQTSCMSFGFPVAMMDATNHDYNLLPFAASVLRPSYTNLQPFQMHIDAKGTIRSPSTPPSSDRKRCNPLPPENYVCSQVLAGCPKPAEDSLYLRRRSKRSIRRRTAAPIEEQKADLSG